MQTLLKFKDHQYYYDQIIAKASIDVKIKIEEINLDPRDFQSNMPIFSIEGVVANSKEIKPIFFKHEGKYIVFRGNKNLIEALISKEIISLDDDDGKYYVTQKGKGYLVSGRLISSPALKLCRYQDPQEVKAIEEANERLRQEQLQAEREAYRPRRFDDRRGDDKPRFRKDGDKPRYGSEKKDAGSPRPPRSFSPNRGNNRNS